MRFDNFTLRGFSLGGVETALWVPELKLAFDVGRGPRELLRCTHIALTHTHMDHVGGLPYLLALRQLFRMPAPTVYVPAQMEGHVRAMLAAWEPVQRYELDAKLVGVVPGERYPVRRDVHLEPFRTYHPVPSVGYTVIEARQKLKPELVGLPGPEIAARRARGETVTHVQERRLLSVTGDTLVQVIDQQPHILESEVLVLECTFLDAQKPLEESRAGGHVHLSELMERKQAFANQTLVLSHFSQIYSEAAISTLLAPFAKGLGPELRAFPVSSAETEIQVTD